MPLIETLTDLPPLPSDTLRELIPLGWHGTARTIRVMQRCVSHGKRDPYIARLVGQIIQKCSSKDWQCYCRALFDWVKSNIRYVYDPNGVEKVCTPRVTIENGMGDCDDMVVVICAFLETIGLECRFVTIKANRKSDEFSHVYGQVRVPGRDWVSLDCTMQYPLGWEAPGNLPRKNWPASLDESERHGGDSMNGLSGLSEAPRSFPWVAAAVVAGLFWMAKK